MFNYIAFGTKGKKLMYECNCTKDRCWVSDKWTKENMIIINITVIRGMLLQRQICFPWDEKTFFPFCFPFFMKINELGARLRVFSRGKRGQKSTGQFVSKKVCISLTRGGSRMSSRISFLIASTWSLFVTRLNSHHLSKFFVLVFIPRRLLCALPRNQIIFEREWDLTSSPRKTLGTPRSEWFMGLAGDYKSVRPITISQSAGKKKPNERKERKKRLCSLQRVKRAWF